MENKPQENSLEWKVGNTLTEAILKLTGQWVNATALQPTVDSILEHLTKPQEPKELQPDFEALVTKYEGYFSNESLIKAIWKDCVLPLQQKIEALEEERYELAKKSYLAGVSFTAWYHSHGSEPKPLELYDYIEQFKTKQ
jgi:hypothetical protein